MNLTSCSSAVQRVTQCHQLVFFFPRWQVIDLDYCGVFLVKMFFNVCTVSSANPFLQECPQSDTSFSGMQCLANIALILLITVVLFVLVSCATSHY